jgi:hypothetical protein
VPSASSVGVKEVTIERSPYRCIARALFAYQGAILSLNHWRVFSKDSFRHGFRHCIIASCMRRIASAIF